MYALRRNVYASRINDQVYLLDLSKDRYLSISATHSAPLVNVVRDWPIFQVADQLKDIDESLANDMVAELIELDLITKDPEQQGSPVTDSVHQPCRDLLSGPPSPVWPISWLHIRRFVISAIVAKFKLRFWSIERIVESNRKRRRMATTSRFTEHMNREKELVSIFHVLKRLAFISSENCLFDSMALLEFLARYGHFPNWIFGIQDSPFIAHCWVQKEDIVFNDTREHVECFKPILIA